MRLASFLTQATPPLLLAGLAACAPGPALQGRITPLPPGTSELSADQRILHALNRIGFGPRPGDLERVKRTGLKRWVEQQLEPDRIPDSTAGAAVRGFSAITLAPAAAAEMYGARGPGAVRFALLRQQAAAGQFVLGGRFATVPPLAPGGINPFMLRPGMPRPGMLRPALLDLQAAKVARAVVSERRLLEVMVDFWENHFSVYAAKGPVAYMLLEYDRDVIRPRALGRFRDLLHAVVRSPAMLYYLDNWQSAAEPGRPTYASVLDGRDGVGALGVGRPPPAPGSPPRGLNENLARELLELHTLGVDGGYTQQDVVNVARALTGWSLETPERVGRFVFQPELHDAGMKRVLGRTLPAGRGIEDGEEVLDMLAAHPATARFIAAKLVRRFVADTPPPALVARAAKVYLGSGGDIREVLRAILTSDEFFSRSAYRAKVKTPFELVVSSLRALGASADSTAWTVSVIGQLGEPLFGHPAPDGYPETAEPWTSSGTIMSRIKFGLGLAYGRWPGVDLTRWFEAAGLPGKTRAEQVDGMLAAVLGGEGSPELRAAMLDADRLPAGARDSLPRKEAPAPPADPFGLRRMLGLALGAPEFQRR